MIGVNFKREHCYYLFKKEMSKYGEVYYSSNNDELNMIGVLNPEDESAALIKVIFFKGDRCRIMDFMSYIEWLNFERKSDSDWWEYKYFLEDTTEELINKFIKSKNDKETI